MKAILILIIYAFITGISASIYKKYNDDFNEYPSLYWFLSIIWPIVLFCMLIILPFYAGFKCIDWLIKL